MTRETTLELAEFAATLRLEAVPDDARESAKALLLDALACAFAGHKGEETGQLRGLASALGASPESVVIGGQPMSLAGATVMNGLPDHRRHHVRRASRDADPCDAGDRPSGARHCRARRCLRWRICSPRWSRGWRVTTRVGLGLDYPAFRARGWHGPGVTGPFGAAAAVGRLRSFDAETMARAFGLAGSQSAGTFAAWGTPTVKWHQCRAALSGLMAALLAEQDFAAARNFLTAPDGGLYSTYAEGGLPELATRGPRTALGIAADRAAAMAGRDRATGRSDRAGRVDIRPRTAFRRYRAGPPRAPGNRVPDAWRIRDLAGEVRGAAFGALRGGGLAAGPDPDARSVSNRTATTIPLSAGSPPSASRWFMTRVLKAVRRSPKSDTVGGVCHSARCDHALGDTGKPAFARSGAGQVQDLRGAGVGRRGSRPGRRRDRRARDLRLGARVGVLAGARGKGRPRANAALRIRWSSSPRPTVRGARN